MLLLLPLSWLCRLLIDGRLGLICQGHMERHVLVLEEPCYGGHGLGAHLLELVCSEVSLRKRQMHFNFQVL